jgi:hypothetical protein
MRAAVNREASMSNPSVPVIKYASPVMESVASAIQQAPSKGQEIVKGGALWFMRVALTDKWLIVNG